MTCLIPIRRLGYRWLAWLAAAVACLTVACTPEEPAVIDWDLSDSHTAEDVGWPNELSMTEFSPVASVRIRLPGDRMFQAGDEVHDVTLEREGDLVTLVQVDFEPQTAEDAYERAVILAEEWGLRRAGLDKWFRQRMAGRAAGHEDVTSTSLATAPAGQRLGPEGPSVSAEIRYSFNDERPSLVSLQFFWNPDWAKPPAP